MRAKTSTFKIFHSNALPRALSIQTARVLHCRRQWLRLRVSLHPKCLVGYTQKCLLVYRTISDGTGYCTTGRVYPCDTLRCSDAPQSVEIPCVNSGIDENSDSFTIRKNCKVYVYLKCATLYKGKIFQRIARFLVVGSYSCTMSSRIRRRRRRRRQNRRTTRTSTPPTLPWRAPSRAMRLPAAARLARSAPAPGGLSLGPTMPRARSNA